MIFCVTGNLGSGKTLVCVGRILDAIREGKRVATNLDLRMEHLSRGGGRTCVVRLPDLPSAADFRSLGRGNEGLDEAKNGVIVLDEIGSVLGSRTWNEKGREGLIDWLKHSRKLGWDIYFIVQHESMLDALVRKALCEHIVICKRLDRLPIPIVGWFIKLIGLSGRLPKIHLATVKYGNGQGSIVQQRWWYRGRDLYAAYDTRQIFSGSKPQGPSTYLDRFSAPWLSRATVPFTRFAARFWDPVAGTWTLQTALGHLE